MLNSPPFEHHAQYVKGIWSPITVDKERGGSHATNSQHQLGVPQLNSALTLGS